MIRNLLLLVCLCCFLGNVNAQNEFYNDGAEVYVQAAGLIYVQGEVINDDQGANIGRMFNSGDIMLEGNWTNTSTSNVFQANDPGTTTFLGNNAVQTIGGTTDTYFNNLTLNKPGGVREVRQLRDALCDQVLNLTDDFLNTQTFIFGVANPNPASITRLGAVSGNINNSTVEGYVTSTPGSAGRLARATSNAFPGGFYFFPVGTSARFRPVAVTPTSVGLNTYSVQFVDLPTPNANLKAATLATINPQWYHFIERALPLGSPEDVRIYWEFAGDDICDINNLTMSEWNSALWDDLSPTTNVNPGVPFLGHTTKNAYPGTYPTPWATNRFALAGLFIAPGVSSCVFPVEMLALEAKPDGSNIRLDWATASETNNAGFEVHRSIDGNVFEYQGWVPGAGNSSDEKNYRFLDEDVQAGVLYYYQLHQRDYNGNMSRSNVVSAIITEGDEFHIGNLFPNPATAATSLHITSPEAYSLETRFINSLGQVLKVEKHQLNAGSQTVEFDTEQLAAGHYILQLMVGQKTFTRKLSIK